MHKSLIGIVIIFMVSAGVSAADLEAQQIAQLAYEHSIFGLAQGARISARMVLTGASSARSERSFEAITKKQDGLLKTVIRFTGPAQVVGTVFLSLQKADASDEQYIYLPRLGSTRRLAAKADREASFMESDFTYADLARHDVSEASYKRLPDETIGQDLCFHVEATPKVPDGQSKQELWIRQRDYVPLRTKLFGRDGKLDKTIFARRIRSVDGRPVVMESHTENARSGHVTDLTLEDVDFKSDIPDSLFTPAALSH